MANKFVSGTLILTLSGFVVKAIGSVNWIILSRILGGEGIGIYQMAFPVLLTRFGNFQRRHPHRYFYYNGRKSGP